MAVNEILNQNINAFANKGGRPLVPTLQEKRAAEQREDDRLGFVDAAKLAWRYDAPLGSYFNNSMPDFSHIPEVPGFEVTDEILRSEGAGLNPDVWDELIPSRSPEELEGRREHLLFIQKQQDKISNSHSPLLATLTGNILDPLVLASIPIGGAVVGGLRGSATVASSVMASRLTSAGLMAGVGAAEMAAIELPRLLNDPTYERDRYFTTVMMGSGISGLFGAAFPSIVLGPTWRNGLPQEVANRDAARVSTRTADPKPVEAFGPPRPPKVEPRATPLAEEMALDEYANKLFKKYDIELPEGQTAASIFQRSEEVGATPGFMHHAERAKLRKLQEAARKADADDYGVRVREEMRNSSDMPIWHDAMAPPREGTREVRGLNTGLRTEVAAGMASPNGRVRQVFSWLGEHSRLKTTGHIASTRANKLSDISVLKYREIERKLVGWGLREGRRRKIMSEFARKYRTGAPMTQVEQEVADELRVLLKSEFEFLKKEGSVVIDDAAAATFDPKWLPRRAQTKAWTKMRKEIGDDEMVDYLTDVLHLSQHTPEQRKFVADLWMRVHTEKNYRQFQNSRFTDSSKFKLFKEELSTKLGKSTDNPSGLSTADIDEIATLMSPRPNQHPFRHLRKRLEADEGFSKVINGKSYAFVDLLENDTDALLLPYFHRMHGFVEWDKMMRKIGLDPDSSIDDVLVWIRESGDIHDVHVESLKYLYRDLMAVPAHEWDTLPVVAWMRHLQEATYIATGGMLGFAQVVEAGNLVAEHGVRHVFSAVPGFQNIVNKIRRGKLRAYPQYWMQAMDETGIGREIRMRSDITRSISDTGWRSDMGDAVTQFASDILATGKGLVNRGVTGLGWIDQSLRSYAVKGSLDSFVRLAYMTGPDGIVKMKPNWVKNIRSRIDDLGLSDKQIDDILETIRDTSTVDVRKFGGVNVTEMRYNRWDPELKDAFFDAVVRWSNRAVQRNSPGNMPKIFRNPVFRYMMMFRSFVTNAFNKQLRYSLNKRDTMAGAAFLYGAGIGGLAYVLKEELDIQLKTASGQYSAFESAQRREKDFTWSRIGAEAFRRVGHVSMFPELMDWMIQGQTGEPFFHKYPQTFAGLIGLSPAPSRYGSNLLNLVDTLSGVPGTSSGADVSRALIDVAPFQTIPIIKQFLDNLNQQLRN